MIKNVLVVDDSKIARNNTKKLLEQLGYNIVGEAVDGADGVEKYQELKPDLIVVDLEMPRLNGVGLIREVRQSDNDIKIIIATSMVASRVLHDITELNATLINKPIKIDKLKEAIEAF